MVKIDTDGADFQVAKGASRLLSQAFSLHVEFAPKHGKSHTLSYIRHLMDKGFTLYPHCGSIVLAELIS